MDFSELLDLIKIREYVVNSVALPAINRKTVTELNGILLLLDEKIIGALTSPEFKEYIGYHNVEEAKKKAANISNIYSTIGNKNDAIHRQIRNLEKK